VDRVIDSYRLLRNANRRLSTADRQRLDDHLARLAELQRKLMVPAGPGCKAAMLPAMGGTPAQRYAAINDVIAMSFTCGTSAAAVLSVRDDNFVSFSGDWHQDIAHQWKSPGPQKLLADAARAVFRYVFLDLARKLDVEEAQGRSYLDSSLIAWTNEAGEQTHDVSGIPVVTVGSAGGFLRTGNFCDLRNRSMTMNSGYRPINPGLPWGQWLGTVLQSMGVPPSEYQGLAGGRGFMPALGSQWRTAYAAGVLDKASQVLPFLKA
jgi:hypothetical protein